MKKRLLMILMAVMLVTSLVTVPALADEGETPSGTTQTLDFTANEIPQGEEWSWDAENKVLTLNNLDFTTDAQYAIVLPGGSTINVPEGTTNTISTTALYDASAVPAAVYCDGDLTITGSGEVKAVSDEGYAIFLSNADSAALTVSGANVTCEAPGAKGNAVCLSSEENMAANVSDSVLTMTSAKGLVISPMLPENETDSINVSFVMGNSQVTASGNLIYGGFWYTNNQEKFGNCAINVALTGSTINAPNGALSLDSRDCNSTLTMSIDNCNATIKGIKALNVSGTASVDVLNTTLSMPSDDPSGTMFHIGGQGNKTVNIEGSTVNMDGQFFLDDNGTSNSITDSIIITSSELSIENSGAAWTVGDGIRLGESAENANFVVSDSKLNINCEGNGVAIGNSEATVNLTLENTDTTIDQTRNTYSTETSKRENGYNAFNVSGNDVASEVSITGGTIIVSSDVVADENKPGEADLISVSGTTGDIDSDLLEDAGLVIYNDEGKLLHDVTINDDIELPSDFTSAEGAKLEVAPDVTVTMPNGDKTTFEEGGTISVSEKEGITTHQHTPGAVVRENEVPATYSSTGSYDEVIYCTECNAELSRKTVTTPKLTASSSSSSSPTYYKITVDSTANGSVKANRSSASKGTVITVTATPDQGYELAYITVNGEQITGTTFTMPGKAVTVSAVFEPIGLPFTDVKPGDWCYDCIVYAYSNGLMNGVSGTAFAPDTDMTRAMVWTILARIDGESITGSTWATDARAWAMAENVSDGTDPDGRVTREQFATMLYRYAVAKGYDVSVGENTNILSYTDYDGISEWAIPAMQWACGSGVITGVTDSTLVPQGTATRAQCTAMLVRFMEL